jgi:uncharacterized membrane protein YsdA (DUF1294 family)/cold shock CspA family protein
MRYQGRITSWKDDQGFGFITKNGSSNQVFVHIHAFKNRRRRPTGNEIVTYELEIDQKGRERAENVAFVGDRSLVASSREKWSISLPLAIGFVAFVAVSAFVEKLPIIVLGLYLGASIIAFAVYAVDKSAAQNNQWRTKEGTLHLLGLIGGWPGALVAQRFLRHKSKKQSFQITFWGTVMLNCGGFVWLLTPEGSTALRSFLDVIEV